MPEYLQGPVSLGKCTKTKTTSAMTHWITLNSMKKAAKHKANLRSAVSYVVDKFCEDARNGNLPEVSLRVAPENLSEHPPFKPMDGSWIRR